MAMVAGNIAAELAVDKMSSAMSLIHESNVALSTYTIYISL